MNLRILAWTAIALWVLLAGALGWLFVRGQTTRSSDGRLAVSLSAQERDRVLAEMRGMLASVQGVAFGLATRDPAHVAGAARASGMAAASDASPALMAKLPLPFKTLGMSVHRGFDELAGLSQSGAPPERVLAHLNRVLESCVACHARYRLP